MSSQAPAPTYLLDKNVVRKIVEGIIQPRSWTPEHVVVLAMWRQLRESGCRQFLSVETANILARWSDRREIRLFLNTVEVLYASRYFKRWARRIREHGFTREDAKLLGLATYGTDATGQMLGVETLVTLDRSLIRHFEVQKPELEKRLRAMTTQLLSPFRDASLPEVVQPLEVFPSLSQRGQ